MSGVGPCCARTSLETQKVRALRTRSSDMASWVVSSETVFVVGAGEVAEEEEKA